MIRSDGKAIEELIRDVLVMTCLRTQNASEMLYVLRVALGSACAELPMTAVEASELGYQKFLEKNADTLASTAQDALFAAARSAVPVAATAEYVQQVSERANGLVHATGQDDSFEILLTLHFAERIVTQVFEKRPDYGPELVGRLASVKRFLDRLDLQVALIPSGMVSKGGSA